MRIEPQLLEFAFDQHREGFVYHGGDVVVAGELDGACEFVDTAQQVVDPDEPQVTATTLAELSMGHRWRLPTRSNPPVRPSGLRYRGLDRLTGDDQIQMVGSATPTSPSGGARDTSQAVLRPPVRSAYRRSGPPATHRPLTGG